MSERNSRAILPSSWTDAAEKLGRSTCNPEWVKLERRLEVAADLGDIENTTESIPGLQKRLIKFGLAVNMSANEESIPFANWLVEKLNSGTPFGEIKLETRRKDGTLSISSAPATSPFVFQALADLAGASIYLFQPSLKPKRFPAAHARYSIGIFCAKNSLLATGRYAAIILARGAKDHTPERPSKRKPPDIPQVIHKIVV